MKHSVHIREISIKEKKEVEDLYQAHKSDFEKFSEKLLWWNSRINLVSRDVSRETLREHMIHSLCISLAESFNNGKKIIDAGSGGGLPGIPLGIVFDEKEIILNDIVEKKMFAAKDMAIAVGIYSRVKAVAGNIKVAETDKETVIITKHAFKVYELYELMKENKWSSMIFLKGHEEALQEIESVEEELVVNITKLDTEFMKGFYSGKAVVEINRIK